MSYGDGKKRIHIGVLGLTNAEKDARLHTLLELACWNPVVYEKEMAYYRARGCFGGIVGAPQAPRVPVAAREDCTHCQLPPEPPAKPTARELRIARRRKEAYGIG